MQKTPSATQKEIAAEIGKSERTVKSITIALQEKNILQRVNGKRNGYWSIVDERLKVQYIVNLKKRNPSNAGITTYRRGEQIFNNN